MDTLYDLLGALPHDDAEDLRTAFRKAVKGAHPDLRPDDPDAALKFREIIRANEILCDPEQRAAYDHLLSLAYVEQEQASKQQAVFTRIYRLASGVMAFAGVSIMTVGGYLLFMHMSAASVAPSDDIDTALSAPPEIVAVSAAAPVDTADKVTSSAKPMGAGNPDAPNVAMVRTNAESVAPVHADPASDPDASEAKALRARGMSAYHHGDVHGAIAALDQALQRDPRFLPAYIDRGTILYRIRKIGRAFADIAPAKRIEKLDRRKPPPAAVGKSRGDQAAITGSVTPSQRRKVTQIPPREDAYTPLWVR
jgi:curved DNA-binding protein CbpA